MCAEGDVAARLANIEANVRFKELPVPFHKRNQRNWHVEQARSEAGQSVKLFFRRSIHQSIFGEGA